MDDKVYSSALSVTDGVIRLEQHGAGCATGGLLEGYYVIRELGAGANGVVFLVQNELLDRKEALKIWTRLRSRDDRDKVQQGIAEARKANQAFGEFVPAIFHAAVAHGNFYTTMEYVPGVTLKEYLQQPRDDEDLWWLGRLYINAISSSTREDLRHGDAHWGNVMVLEEPRGLSIRLLDFGTSIFTEHDASEERHWRIVRETFHRILNRVPGLRKYADQLRGDWKLDSNPHLWIGHFDDLLDFARMQSGRYQAS